MLTKVILSVIGSDRPGLTGALATAVEGAGGNWLESHLARLGGKYVGSVLVELPETQLDALRIAVTAVDALGLHVAIVAAGEADADGDRLSLSVVGQDRPGIVREVTTALAARDVNILSLTSGTEATAWSGSTLFRAALVLQVPAGLPRAAVQDALEGISQEIMVDFAAG